MIYTTRLEACRDFYAGLRLDLVPARGAGGPASGRRTLTDPDGRTVVLTVMGRGRVG
ncbi:hypothetical protein ACGFYU_06195 [Streptomyces sp. NPDC048337]|uniref:hypothetical protein n=1 Tax=Streptomyces sp. NPDC048337 TaxID=3365535 RepID=UPI003712F0BC